MVGIMPCNLEPEDGPAALFVNRTDNMRETSVVLFGSQIKASSGRQRLNRSPYPSNPTPKMGEVFPAQKPAIQ